MQTLLLRALLLAALALGGAAIAALVATLYTASGWPLAAAVAAAIPVGIAMTSLMVAAYHFLFPRR